MTPEDLGDFLSEFYPAFLKERYRDLLHFFELPCRPIRSMSAGQKTKVELAAGFSKGAGYILMDEPFSDKDIFTRRDFLKIMAGSLRDTESILLSTHLVLEIENFLDRALILHQGRLDEDVEMDALHESGNTLEELMNRVVGYEKARPLAFLKNY